MLLAIDPSTTRSGWALFGFDGQLRGHGSWPHKGRLFERLGDLHYEVCECVWRHGIGILAMESQFAGRFPKAALQVSRAAGVVLAAFAEMAPDITQAVVHELSPTAVKKAVGCSGRADKDRVRMAVAGRFGVFPDDDAADAIALGWGVMTRLLEGTV